jgi:hypothetical protein
MSDESKKLQTDFASGTALTPARNQTVVDLDGFNDFTNEVEGAEDDRVNTSAGVIQGTKLKFIDPRWLIDGRDVTGMLLTVIGVRNVVNKWSADNRPLVTNILTPGVKFPDFKALNAKEPQSEWRMAFGQLRGPWEGQHCLYLIDEHFNRFTWASPTSTIGSAIAVEEIVDHIKMLRKFRGSNVYAVVELGHVHFRNRFSLTASVPSSRYAHGGAGGQSPRRATSAGQSSAGAHAARRAGRRQDRRACHARGRNG